MKFWIVAMVAGYALGWLHAKHGSVTDCFLDYLFSNKKRMP